MAQVAFTAMGSPARIVADGVARPDIDDARRLIEHLEQSWSRFRVDSSISRLNQHAGCLTLVDPDTFALVERAQAARTMTAGGFNPLMLDQLRRLGYHRSWHEGPPVASFEEVGPGSTEPIDLFPEIGAVRLPPATAFDPGGIGKGLAVDRAVDLLLDRGARGVSVEIGGDLRVAGACWYADRWRVDVAHPQHPTEIIAVVEIDEGAVATSSTLRRCWMAGSQRRHHLLDPSTGYPAQTDLVAVTTCSSQAWWAEVLAKTALIAGRDQAAQILRAQATAGVMVDGRGEVRELVEVGAA